MEKKDKKKNYNLILSILIIILVILILLTSMILASRTQDYTKDDITTIFLVDTDFNYRVGDDEQTWKIKETIDLFAKAYNKVNNNHLVESGDNDNVIAPNTSYDYDFDITNTGNVPINYSLYIKPTLYIEGKKQDIKDFPIEVRIKNGSNKYFYGTSERWEPISGLLKFQSVGSLKKSNTAKYTIEWVWNENKNDELDTYLGSLSASDEIMLKVDIEVLAELAAKDLGTVKLFSTEKENIGGAIKLWPFVLIILLILVILLSIAYIYVKLRKEEEDKK